MTVGCWVAVATFTAVPVPVSTCARYASWTACVEDATSMPLPALPYTATALPDSNLIVPSLAEPEPPAALSRAALSFSSSTGISGSTTRSWPNSEPITETGL